MPFASLQAPNPANKLTLPHAGGVIARQRKSVQADQHGFTQLWGWP